MNWMLALLRLNLWLLFTIFFVGHSIMYYLLQNSDWFHLALSASLVDTGILGMVQYWLKVKTQQQK